MKYIFLTLFLLGCTSNINRHYKEQKIDDFVETFDLQEKEFTKFKISKGREESPLEKRKVKIKKKVLKKRSYKKIKKIAKRAQLPQVSEVPESKVIETAAIDYPKGFPEDLKELDKKSQKYWATSRQAAKVGEKNLFAIKFLGIPIGYITFLRKKNVRVGQELAYHYVARLQSESFYSAIYSLDDSIESFVSVQTNLPIKFSLMQRESKQTVDDLQLFDHEKMKTFYWYKRLKRGEEKREEKSAFIPRYFQDSFSALYFMRGFRMKKGDVYEIPLINRAKLSLSKIRVHGLERIKVNRKWIRAIRLVGENHLPGLAKKKKGSVLFWVLNDASHRLVKFKATIKLGTVLGELVSYEPGH